MGYYEKYGFSKDDTFATILDKITKPDDFIRLKKNDIERYYKALQRTANTRLNAVRLYNTNAVRALNKRINKFGKGNIDNFKFGLKKDLTYNQMKRELSIMRDFLLRPSSLVSWEKKHREKVSKKIFDVRVFKSSKNKKHVMTVPEAQVEFDVYRRLEELAPLIEARYYESDTVLSVVNDVINENVYKSYFKKFKATVPIGQDIKDSRKYQKYIDDIASELKSILEASVYEDVNNWNAVKERIKKEREASGQKSTVLRVSHEDIEQLLQRRKKKWDI